MSATCVRVPGGSTRTRIAFPIGSSPGHRALAPASLTMVTGASAAASPGRNPRPWTIWNAEHFKVAR